MIWSEKGRFIIGSEGFFKKGTKNPLLWYLESLTFGLTVEFLFLLFLKSPKNQHDLFLTAVNTIKAFWKITQIEIEFPTFKTLSHSFFLFVRHFVINQRHTKWFYINWLWINKKVIEKRCCCKSILHIIMTIVKRVEDISMFLDLTQSLFWPVKLTNAT